MSSNGRPITAADLAAAYRAGKASPVDVAKAALAAIEQSDRLAPPLRAFIASRADLVVAQAEASARRFAAGAPLGLLDGVPAGIKDEFDVEGYPTTVGTAFLGKDGPAREDSGVAARLRAAGAVLLGKTNLHEIGLGGTGINPHHRSARNPHDTGRMTGGSSSGSAASVAAGISPIAVGSDAGGSIRIPSSLCGVVGLKPTYGRVTQRGGSLLAWSLDHTGPIGATVADVAASFAVLAGPDPLDAQTLGQPPVPSLADLEAGVAGLRLGVSAALWEGGRPTADVERTCRGAVEALRSAGAAVLSIEIPDIQQLKLVEYVTLGAEAAASNFERRRLHMREYGADVRLFLSLGSRITAQDYIRAQRLRSLIRAGAARALGEVDAILLPATACTAPPILPDAEEAGEVDDATTSLISAYTFFGNLTGLPALSVPCGYDAGGLPVGLQVIGRAWDEGTVLRVGRAVERLTFAEPRRPAVHYEILPRDV